VVYLSATGLAVWGKALDQVGPKVGPVLSEGNPSQVLTFYTLYVVLLFVAAATGVALAAYAWRQRRTPGAMAFTGMVLGMSLWSFALAMMAFTNSPEAADFWGRRVRFIANATMPVLILVFVIRYTGRQKWLSWPRLALLFIIPLITLILTWSGEAHYLFLHFLTEKAGPFTFLGPITTRGPWNAVHLTYSYLALFLSLGLLLLQVFRTRFPYRGQAILLLAGTLIPLAANVPDSFFVEGPRPSFTPFGFAAMGLIYAWALFRYRLFDIVPIARDLVIESMGDAMLILDEQHRLVDVNPAAQALMGCKDSTLIGQPIADLLPAWSEPVERQDSRLHAEIVMGEGEGVRHLALSEQPIRDRSEHLVGYLVMLRDITDRKKTEEKLVQEKRILEEIVNSLPGVFYMNDSQTALVQWNRRFEQVTGYAAEELVGKKALDFFVQKDRALVASRLEKVLAEGQADVEACFLTRDGRAIPYYFTASRIDLGGQAYFVGLGIDIADRKEAEDALQRAHDTLEQRVAERTAELAEEKQVADHIINSLPGIFYVYDDQSRLIRWNDRHRELTGYRDEELLHKSVLEFFAQEDQELIARRLEQLYGEGAAQAEAPILTKAGDQIPMLFTGVLTTLAGQPVFMGLGVDITHRKKMETELEAYRHHLEELVAQRTAELRQARDAAEAANRAKSAFLANMSHELRTPLNAILGLAQVLEHDPDLVASQKESLDIIGRSGEHLLDLVNDVLEISRIEAGRASLNLAEFDLYRTLNRLEEMVGVQAKRRGLALLFERAENVPRYVRSDERKLRQVLLNLLANAIKFTEVGSVRLRISRQEMAPDSLLPSARHLLRFEVQDTGVGIAPAETEALFEPFVQGENGQKRQGGAGLGLTISREYVELMGGEISVSSPPPIPLTSRAGGQGGPGTLFTVTLPVELVDASEPDSHLPTRRAIGLAPGWPDAAPPRILVVDDSQENRVVLREMLERVGFSVREAAGGEEAVDLHTSWQPHLIWMDIRMPGVDGYEATRRIRQGVNSKLAAVPIIAVTASAFEEDRATVLAAGCDDFVRKPFRKSEVLEVTARHLGIEYLYQQLPGDLEGKGDRLLFVALAPDDLRDLPDAWVNDLRQAARRGRAGQVLALIERIERERPQLARGLRALVRESRFLDIVTAAEGSRDGR
jgi:PAS domain S-box-containing protein